MLTSMSMSYLEGIFDDTTIISNDNLIIKISDELRKLNYFHQTVIDVPRRHVKVLKKSKDLILRTKNKVVQYWTDQDRKWYEKIALSIKISEATFRIMSNYLNKPRICRTCGIQYSIKNNLGNHCCPRVFGFGTNKKQIYSMHSDGETTKFGFLKIPFYAFVLLGVNIPRRKSIRFVSIDPINKDSNTQICLAKSFMSIHVSKE